MVQGGRARGRRRRAWQQGAALLTTETSGRSAEACSGQTVAFLQHHADLTVRPAPESNRSSKCTTKFWSTCFLATCSARCVQTVPALWNSAGQTKQLSSRCLDAPLGWPHEGLRGSASRPLVSLHCTARTTAAVHPPWHLCRWTPRSAAGTRTQSASKGSQRWLISVVEKHAWWRGARVAGQSRPAATTRVLHVPHARRPAAGYSTNVPTVQHWMPPTDGPALPSCCLPLPCPASPAGAARLAPSWAPPRPCRSSPGRAPAETQVWQLRHLCNAAHAARGAAMRNLCAQTSKDIDRQAFAEGSTPPNVSCSHVAAWHCSARPAGNALQRAVAHRTLSGCSARNRLLVSINMMSSETCGTARTGVGGWWGGAQAVDCCTAASDNRRHEREHSAAEPPNSASSRPQLPLVATCSSVFQRQQRAAWCRLQGQLRAPPAAAVPVLAGRSSSSRALLAHEPGTPPPPAGGGGPRGAPAPPAGAGGRRGGEGAEVQLAGKQRLPLACRGVAQQRQRVCEVAEEGRRRRRRWRRCLKRSGSAPDPLPTPAAPPFTPDLHGTVPAAAPTCILPPHLLWRERRQHVPLVGGRRRRSRLRASRPVGAPRAGVGWRARMLLPAGGAQSARGLPLRRAGAPLAGLAAGARCRGQLGLHLPQPVDRWRWGGHRGVRRGSSCRAGACARSSRPPAALGVFQRLTWRVGLCQSVQEAGRRGDGQEHSRKGVKSAGSSREAGQQHRQREQQRVRASGVAWPQMGAPTAATGFADVLAALACLLGVLARACIASTSSDHRSLHHHGLTSALRCRLSFRTAPSRKFVELRPLQGLIQASHGLTQQ